MTVRVARFDELSWVPGAHPLERKRGPAGNLVVLEFEPGFEDPNVCVRSHVIYVLEGELDVRLRDRVERLQSGQAISLAAGVEHQVGNPGQVTTRLFIVSDIAPISG